MLGCEPASTPVESNVKTGICEESSPVNKDLFQILVRRLTYLNHNCPDISFPVSYLS